MNTCTCEWNTAYSNVTEKHLKPRNICIMHWVNLCINKIWNRSEIHDLLIGLVIQIHTAEHWLYALRPFPALQVLVEPCVSFSRLCWISVISVCARFLFMCLCFLGKVPVYRTSVSLVLHPGHLMFLLHLLSWNMLQLTEENKDYNANDCFLTSHFTYLHPMGLIWIILHFVCLYSYINFMQYHIPYN